MLESLETLLEGGGDRYRWSALCDLMVQMRAQDAVRFDEQSLPVIERALLSWDDALKVVPPDWTMRYFDPDETDPLLSLPRVLRYQGREDYLLRQREQIELSLRATHLHTLEIYGQYYYNQHIRPVLTAFGALRNRELAPAIATLRVYKPSEASIEGWSDLPLVSALTVLRFSGHFSYSTTPEQCLPKHSSTLRELSSTDPLALPEVEWLFGLHSLFVKGKDTLATARQIEGLRGLAVQGRLEQLFEGEPRWDLRKLRFDRMITIDDVAQLTSLPGLVSVEEIEGETTRNVEALLIDAKAAGRLPALLRARLSRNIYNAYDDSSIDNYGSSIPAAYLGQTLGEPLERSTLYAADARSLVYSEKVIGPFELLNEDEESDGLGELVVDRIDQLLARLADHPPQTLKVVSPHPDVTARLLAWPRLREVRDLVLICDTFMSDEDCPDYLKGLEIPYRADDQEFDLLARCEALAHLERLHLALSFTRDDRWRKKRLASLPAIPKLYTLDLGRGELLDADLKRLLSSSLLSGVVRLSLAGNRCTNVSELFRKDDGTFSRLEYLDLSDITGYNTTGSMSMSSDLPDTTTFRKLTTLQMEGSAKTEFGEEAAAYMGGDNLPNLSEITTSHYYVEVFE